MICTRCGRENPDEASSCQGCGHKLQSGLPGWPSRPRGGSPEPLPPIPPLGPAARRRLERLAEAWAVAILVWAASFLLLRAGLDWGLYPLGLAAAGYAWLRGIRWRD